MRIFTRSTISDCAAIRRMGESIGLSRGRGVPESEAVRDGIDLLTGEFGLARDQKTRFTGRVYGIMLYRLDKGHSAQVQAAYSRAICRVYRDTNQIIPVDPASERAINERLRSCDRTTTARADLDDCVLRGLLEIVERAA